MLDAFAILGLPTDADDDAIRRRYLELVREFSPERHPEKFSQIRQAYEQAKDLETRLNLRLFELDDSDSIASIIEDMSCKSPRPRLSLKKMIEQATAR